MQFEFRSSIHHVALLLLILHLPYWGRLFLTSSKRNKCKAERLWSMRSLRQTDTIARLRKKNNGFRGKNRCIFPAVEEFNLIFHMTGEVLKGGQGEGNVSRTKAWCMLCSVMTPDRTYLLDIFYCFYICFCPWVLHELEFVSLKYIFSPTKRNISTLKCCILPSKDFSWKLRLQKETFLFAKKTK